MAIIYSYPEIPDVQGGDLLLISDTGAPNKPTRSVDIDDLAAYIGTVVGVVQNLQSVLTVGNTYVSPDGYGTFTLNNIADNNGDIKYVNTDEGWGYFLNAEEGLFFTDGTGGQTGRTGIGLDTVFIGNSNHIGIIRSANITADRTYELPNASGTIALENLSNWYSVTGSRGLGNLLVKIGDYDNSGNGTFLSIDDADQSMTFTKGGVVESKFVFTATQDRDYTFPNADGTIALTSDIPTPGPSGSGTTNYTARWTNASTLGIGALYDNGTNVGIGTANPTQKLEVNGTVLLSTLPNNNGRLCLGSVSTNLFSNAASGHLYVSTNGSTRMTILNNGNVGIGTTSPSSKLHLEDSISNGSVFKITTSTSGTLQPVFDARISSNGDTYYDLNAYKSATKKIQIKSANTSYIQQVDGTGGFDIKGHLKTSLQTVNGGGVLQLHRYGALSLNDDASYTHQPASALYINTLYNTSTDYLMLLANQGSDKLAVDLNGNLGIGTINPSQKLEVIGNVKVSSTIYSPNLATWGNVPMTIRSDDYIRFLTSSSNNERMRILNNGNIGIGTTSPSEKLEVNGGINIGTSLPTVGALSNKLNFWGYTAGQGVCASIGSYRGNNYVSGGLIFETGELTTSEKMRITPTGNVGIGTTAPTSILHLKSDTSTLTLESSDTTLNPDQVWAFLDFKQNDGSQTPVGSVANISAVAKAGNTNFGNLLFQTKSRPADTYNDTLFLSSSGNVGIGTTGPSEKLHVFDTAVVVKIEGNGVTSANLKFKTNETDRWNLNVPSGSTDLRFTTGSSDTLTLKSSGNVGIGTTSPSAKLHVVRTIDADGSLEDNLQLKVENTIEDRPSGIEFRSKRSASASDSAAIVYTTTTATTNTRQIHLIPEIGVSGDLSNSSLIAKAGGQVKVGNSTYAAQALEISGTSVRLDSGPGGDFTFEHPRNGNVFFQVNNQTTLTLDKNNGGKVGIGTTAPTTKLQVNGDVRIYDENELYFGGTGSVPNWEMTASGSDLIVNDTGTNVGSVLFNNDEGVALPRLTTTEINAISSPTQGLMAYNTTLNTICFYNGSSWQKVSHANM